MNKGTSQRSRKNKALDANYISIDERSILDLVQFTLEFSKNINYYSFDNRVVDDWQKFFLNDPAFIIAMIANIDVNEFKINHNEQKIENKCENITHKIEHWQNLLEKTNYDGELIREISDLLKLVKNRTKNLKSILKLEEEEKISWIDRTNAIYENLVFIKEKATRKFEKEIVKKSDHHPHIGLLLAFFQLYKSAQEDINSLTKKHLDYYYCEILQQQRKKNEPNTAIIVLKLDEVTEDLMINEGDTFDFIFEEKRKCSFEATSTTQINNAKIAEIRTLYKSDYAPYSTKLDEENFTINVLYDANILINEIKNLNLLDEEYSNLPAVLGEEQKDSASLERTMNLSEVGFLISSPSLILEKGKQKINITFKITPKSYNKTKRLLSRLMDQESEHKNEIIKDEEKRKMMEKRVESKFFRNAFQLYITTKEGWVHMDYAITKFDSSEKTLTFIIQMQKGQDTLVPFDTEIHEGDFELEYPCVKLLLNTEAQYHPYKFLEHFVIENISITSAVSEVSNITLSNAIGGLDNSVPYAPFGPTPDIGSYLKIQSPLILQKYLSTLELKLDWSGLPQQRDGFKDYYKAYPEAIDNKVFKAVITQVKNNEQISGKQNQQQFELFDTNGETLSYNETRIHVDLRNLNFSAPINPPKDIVEVRANPLFIVLTNPDMAFGHKIFSDIYAEAALKSSRFRRKPVTLPKQPYTPMLEQLMVNYSNTAKEIMLRKQDDKVSDIKLIHIHPFGHVHVFPGPIKSEYFLLPRLVIKGNLYIGLTQIISDDIVSIGFELIPAIYPHTVIKAPDIQWNYLSNNEWLPLKGLLLEDSTDGLIKSGIVKIKIPKTIQLNNTRFPKGKFWISAVSKEGKEDLNSKIKRIFTQAVAVTSSTILSEVLPNLDEESKVQKINFEGKKGIAEIVGPFALTNNEPTESEDSFYSRLSEQLRHKNRVVSNWDFERLILEKFTQIGKVRAYGRNSHPDELIKGSTIQIVVLPKNNLNDYMSRGRKEVAFNTLNKIKKYVAQFVSPYAKIEVSNPVYEQLKIRCRVKFIDYQKRGNLKNELNKELVNYLSPDIENSFIKKGFDESISKTEIINFIESRSYVDFVTNFSVIQLIEVRGGYKILDTARIDKIEELRTISPYAILTSTPEHQIIVIKNEKPSPPEISGIEDFSIASDFVISDNDGEYT